MNDKTNLYVFEKKEVALIFIFMICIAITSFVLGVRVGKNYSYDSAGLNEEDRQKVEMLSTQEEAVNKVVEGKEEVPVEEKTKVLDETYKMLKEKFNNLEEEKKVKVKAIPTAEENSLKAAPKVKAKKDIFEKFDTSKKNDSASKHSIKTTLAAIAKGGQATKPKMEDVVNDKSLSKEVLGQLKKRDELSGKFTVQLGSYQSMSDAEKFADGFRVRGYNPIINEVKIPNRGTWYRVSLGVFKSFGDAKDYIVNEQSLFRGTDYVVGRFD